MRFVCVKADCVQDGNIAMAGSIRDHSYGCCTILLVSEACGCKVRELDIVQRRSGWDFFIRSKVPQCGASRAEKTGIIASVDLHATRRAESNDNAMLWSGWLRVRDLHIRRNNN